MVKARVRAKLHRKCERIHQPGELYQVGLWLRLSIDRRPVIHDGLIQHGIGEAKRLWGLLNMGLAAMLIEPAVRWARAMGVHSVIFREFSQLDEHYKKNATQRYIDANRVSIETILIDCLANEKFTAAFTIECITEGYYFWNLRGKYHDMEVIFEVSDYALMRQRHDSGRLYKLVFHANGHLCSGWNPQQNLLFAPDIAPKTNIEQHTS